jgi:hypothetical protein
MPELVVQPPLPVLDEFIVPLLWAERDMVVVLFCCPRNGSCQKLLDVSPGGVNPGR